jgi:hypothetical protein
MEAKIFIEVLVPTNKATEHHVHQENVNILKSHITSYEFYIVFLRPCFISFSEINVFLINIARLFIPFS